MAFENGQTKPGTYKIAHPFTEHNRTIAGLLNKVLSDRYFQEKLVSCTLFLQRGTCWIRILLEIELVLWFDSIMFHAFGYSKLLLF